MIYCVYCYRDRPEAGGRYEYIEHAPGEVRELFLCAECVPQVDEEREAERAYREFHAKGSLRTEAA